MEMKIEQMEMDEDLTEFVYDAFEDDEVFYSEYEFDAPQFFDFTHLETEWESIEVERWFETSRGYPPPPVLMKLKWASDMTVEKLNSSGNGNGEEGTWNSNGTDSLRCMDSEVSSFDGSKTVRCSSKGLIKPDGKSRGNSSSTLMKPTASHLAKQRKPGEAHNRRFLISSQNLNRSCFQQSAIESQATKRQKLQASYICKGAYLKQENSFPHKLKKVKPSNLDVPNQTRVTIPKEPHLETANRAQRYRLKVDQKTAEQEKSNEYIFKAQSLNKKVNRKNISDFCSQRQGQVRDMRRNIKSLCFMQCITNSSQSLKQEGRSKINKLKGGPLSKISSERKLAKDVPTELFSKLSLTSQVQETVKPHPNDHAPMEGMKENNPASIHGEHKIVDLVKEEGIHGHCRKHHQCGNEGVCSDICSHFYSIRNVNIR